MAPEILEGCSYKGDVVDLFAAGIILFFLYAGRRPFGCASQDEDDYYHYLVNNVSKFWNDHSDYYENPGFFSDDFKDLITHMLSVNPNQRLSMAEIIDHPWVAGPTATKEDVKYEFEERHQ